MSLGIWCVCPSKLMVFDRFELDQEQISHHGSDRGVGKALICFTDGGQLDRYVIATTATSLPASYWNCETVEVRQLLDGGIAHVQVRVPYSHVFDR